MKDASVCLMHKLVRKSWKRGMEMSNSNIRRSGKTVFLILTPLIVAGLLLYVPWVPESTKILFLGAILITVGSLGMKWACRQENRQSMSVASKPLITQRHDLWQVDIEQENHKQNSGGENQTHPNPNDLVPPLPVEPLGVEETSIPATMPSGQPSNMT